MKNNWKKDFDEQFKELSVISGMGDGTLHGYDAKPYVIDFIESLLVEQKKELMECVQEAVQERMMKYDSKDGYSNLHDEIMEKVWDDVTDIFKHHD